MLGLTACGNDGQAAFEWAITLTGAEGNPYTENLTYQLSFVPESALVNLSIDGENFASGQISGCDINYESVVWQEPGENVGGFDVRWKLDGSATYQQTGGCSPPLPENLDWQGEEIFTIVVSDNPDIPPGATYTVTTEGTFVGEASL